MSYPDRQTVASTAIALKRQVEQYIEAVDPAHAGEARKAVQKAIMAIDAMHAKDDDLYGGYGCAKCTPGSPDDG